MKLLNLSEQFHHERDINVNEVTLKHFGLEGVVQDSDHTDHEIIDSGAFKSALENGDLTLFNISIVVDPGQIAAKKSLWYGKAHIGYDGPVGYEATVNCQKGDNACLNCDQYQNGCELSPYIKVVSDNLKS